MLGFHIFCSVFCFSAEMFETSLGNFGNIIRLCEYICILLSAGTMVQNVTLVFRHIDLSRTSQLECFQPQNDLRTFGSSFEWLLIEFLVYSLFMATLALCMIKTFFGYSICADSSR